MRIQFYNSLTRTKEEFVPLEQGKVKIYCCGVTVYDRCHLGHARGAINFDVLRNLFDRVGYKVTFVKNYTDIDDKIINRANERGIEPKKLAEDMIAQHDLDMGLLGVHTPDKAPRATEHIGEIIEMIERLMEKGIAYKTGDGVYYKVREFKEYGKLSGKNVDDLISGARVDVDDNKEDALDFALWKFKKEGEPFWPSPWGDGRPGWHIECSAMSKKILGETFDIHAGGSDLIFPHHENEIAQSEACWDKTFARYWLHNGMIQIDKQKMSKSLGNFALIAELVEKYHPEVLRFFILSTQYRHSLSFSAEAVERSAEGLDRLYRALEGFQTRFPQAKGNSATKEAEGVRQKFLKDLSDDLNTPLAIGTLFEVAKNLNLEKDEQAALGLKNLLVELGSVLGLFGTPAAEWFQSPRIKTEKTEMQEKEILEAIEQRKKARADKDWSLADKIRDELLEKGVLLEDKGGETLWKRK